MSNATSNSKTFTSLVQLLDDCNAHILGKCFRIYNSAIVQHNLTVESIQPLLESNNNSNEFLVHLSEKTHQAVSIESTYASTDESDDLEDELYEEGEQLSS